MTGPQETSTTAGRETAVLADAEIGVTPAQPDVKVPLVQADTAVPPAQADIAMPTAAQKSEPESADLAEAEQPVADAWPGMGISTSESTAESCEATEAATMPVVAESVAVTRGTAPERKFSAPATAIRVQRVEVPQQILAQLINNVRPAIRIAWRRLPIIAGENAADYFEVLNSAVEEWNPITWAECSLVKQIVDSEWVALQFQEFRSCLFNAAIAEGLVARIVDRETENDGNNNDRIVHQDPGVEPRTHQGWLRTIRRAALDAVAGDEAAIVSIENRIGIGTVAMGPHTVEGFERRIASFLSTDRLLNDALARRNQALSELIRLNVERSKRIFEKRATVADLSPPEYIKLMVTARNAEREPAAVSLGSTRETQ